MNIDRDITNLLNFLVKSAAKSGIMVDSSGFIRVDDLLNLDEFNHLNTSKILALGILNWINFDILFKLKNDNLMIGISNGHQFPILKKNIMTEITPKLSINLHSAVFGCTISELEYYLKEGIFKRNNEQHILLDTQLSKHINNYEIFIIIDINRILAHNIVLYLSQNQRIVTDGNYNGVIPPSCFKTIIDWKLNKLF